MNFVAQDFKTKTEDLFQASLQAQLIAKQVLFARFGGKFKRGRLFYNENPVVSLFVQILSVCFDIIVNILKCKQKDQNNNKN